MSNSINIEELLTAVDQATRPFKNQQTTSVSLTESINETEANLRSLNDQLAQVSELKQAEKDLTHLSIKLRAEQERAVELAAQNQTPDNARQLAITQLRVSRMQQQQSNLRDTVTGQRSALTQSGLDVTEPSAELERLQSRITESASQLNSQRKAQKRENRQQKIQAFQAALQGAAEKFATVSESGKSIAATGFNLGKTILQPGYEASLNADQPQGQASVGQTVSAGNPVPVTQGGNLGTDLQALQDAYQSLSVDIFATQASSLRMLVQTATEFVGTLQQWVQNNQGIVQSFGMVATAVIGVAGAVGYVASAIGPMFSGISGLITIATSLGGVFSTVFGGILTVLAGLSWPIIAVVGAFAAGAALIYTLWEPISAFLSGVISSISVAFAPVAEMFTPFQPIFDALGGALQNIAGFFADLISPIHFSQETLESCASAGVLFGQFITGSLTLIIEGVKLLGSGLTWLLEKIGIIDKKPILELPKKPVEALPEGINQSYIQPTATMPGYNNYQAAKPAGGNSYVDQSKREYNVTLQGDIKPGSDNERYLQDLFRQDAESKRNTNLSQFDPSRGF